MLCIYRIQPKGSSLSFVWELIRDCPQDVGEAWELAEALTKQTNTQHVVGKI